MRGLRPSSDSTQCLSVPVWGKTPAKRTGRLFRRIFFSGGYCTIKGGKIKRSKAKRLPSVRLSVVRRCRAEEPESGRDSAVGDAGQSVVPCRDRKAENREGPLPTVLSPPRPRRSSPEEFQYPREQERRDPPECAVRENQRPMFPVPQIQPVIRFCRRTS